MSKKTINTTFKTPLLNDCTNHLAFQLKPCRAENENKPQQKNIHSTHETPLADIVTYEFIRGYN